MRFTKKEFCKAFNTYVEMSEKENCIADNLGVTEWVGDEWVSEYLTLIFNMCDIPDTSEYDRVYDVIFEALAGQNDIEGPEGLWEYLKEELNFEVEDDD